MRTRSGKPKISVCVATYNQRAYIKECLLSVLEQQCDADLEILVGDDCSTDGTSDVIRQIAVEHPNRLTVVIREKNLGACANGQDLIARATGDFLAHLDGDDYWNPGKLSAQLAFLQAHPECSAVYTNAIVINNGGERIGVFNNPQPTLIDVGYLLRCGNFLNYSSIFYRAQFKDVILDIAPNFLDYQVHLRLSRKGVLGYLNQNLVSYRLGSTTSTIAHLPDEVCEYYWKALCDPAIAEGASRDLTSSIADFYSNVLIDSMMRRRVLYPLKWATKIWAKHGIHSCLAFAASIPRSGAKYSRIRLESLLSRVGLPQPRVFHKR